jgi:poly(hydroxyalkanoate) depolymerase family esterase
MNDRLSPGMLEATRLTRAGRLSEATELLQCLLRGEAAAQDSTSETTSDTMNAPHARVSLLGVGAQRTVEATDRLPPWRTAKTFPTGSHSWPAGRVAGAVHGVAQPEARRSFLDQVSRSGFETGIPGVAERPSRHLADLVPSGGQFISGSYGNQAGSRAYKLYIPSDYRGQALPLVVMLHGCTQSPDDFAAGTRMNLLAEEQTCFVAYPAQAASANFSKCWNWFRPGHQKRGEGEPSLIAGITRKIMGDYSVDLQRVYVAGLSAGAAAAAIMGMTYSDLYAAIGVHSGLTCGAASDVLSAFAAMRRGKPAAGTHSSHRSAGGHDQVVPTIVFHGDRDRTVHPCNGDQVIEQATIPAITDLDTRVENGRVPAGHAYCRTLHANASGQTILEQWLVRGAGHAWSGGSPAGSFTDPRGPDASREMLRFFLEHAHPTVAQRV